MKQRLDNSIKAKILFDYVSSTDTPKDNTETPYFEPTEGDDETYIFEPGTSS